MKIDQGNVLICIKDLKQNNELLFTAGIEYQCPANNAIIDNNGNDQYGWNSDMIKTHFKIKNGGK